MTDGRARHGLVIRVAIRAESLSGQNLCCLQRRPDYALSAAESTSLIFFGHFPFPCFKETDTCPKGSRCPSGVVI